VSPDALPLPVALTIAGSDSGGGAGLQADLKTWEAFGVFGASVVTCVTAQNTREVRAIGPISTTLIRDQLEAVFDDLPIVAVKTGLLPSPEIAETVGEVLRARGAPPLVVDPVLVATSGDSMTDRSAAPRLFDSLLGVTTLLTPNLYEAGVLTGREVATLADMRDAARVLIERGPAAVLVKGGHLEGLAVDVLLDDAGFEEFAAERIDAGPTHGTGCTLAAAITAGLARAESLRDAIGSAKRFVHAALRSSRALGSGARVLDHRVRR